MQRNAVKCDGLRCLLCKPFLEVLLSVAALYNYIIMHNRSPCVARFSFNVAAQFCADSWESSGKNWGGCGKMGEGGL